MFGKALGLPIFLLAATVLPGFPASLPFLRLHCQQSHSTTRSLSPPVYLGRPTHIFNCLQQTGHFFPGPFYPTTTGIAWDRLSNESLLSLSLWLSEAQVFLGEGRISCSWEGDVITKIPDQQVVLLGDLAKDNLAIPRMLVEGYTKVCTKSIWVLPSPEV